MKKQLEKVKWANMLKCCDWGLKETNEGPLKETNEFESRGNCEIFVSVNYEPDR
jgi:hypothetical protein